MSAASYLVFTGLFCHEDFVVIASCLSTEIEEPCMKKGQSTEMCPVHEAGSREGCDGRSCCLGLGSEKVSCLETTFTLTVEMLYLCCVSV